MTVPKIFPMTSHKSQNRLFNPDPTKPSQVPLPVITFLQISLSLYFHVVHFLNSNFSCFILSMMHFPRDALFSCCTFFVLHSLCVVIFSCCTLSMLHFFCIAFYSCFPISCTFLCVLLFKLFLCSIHVSLFSCELSSCCILFMLYFFHGLLFSCCFFYSFYLAFMFHFFRVNFPHVAYFSCCTRFTLQCVNVLETCRSKERTKTSIEYDRYIVLGIVINDNFFQHFVKSLLTYGNRGNEE